MLSVFYRTGHMWATCVKKLEPPPMSQGVVCSLKENFGFIERSDVVREIFFHYSEYDGNIAELVLGDDVEFNIQTRNVSFITDFFTIQMAL